MSAPKPRRTPLPAVMEFMPSLGWVTLMVLPVLLQYEMLHPVGRQLQVVAVLLIGIALMAGDWLACHLGRVHLVNRESLPGTTGLTLVGSAFLVPAAIHLLMMPRIPLLAALFDANIGAQSLHQLRDDSAKFLDVPVMAKYLFNWSLFVFGPIFVGVSMTTGHRIQGIAGLSFGCLYALASLAKFPVILFLCASATATAAASARLFASIGYTVVAVLVAASLFAAGWDVIECSMAVDGNHLTMPSFRVVNRDDPRLTLSCGDRMRLTTNGEESNAAAEEGVAGALHYLFYRVWLTPADVSNRWYQYFTYVTNRPLGLQFLLPWERSGDTATPSRLVGVWAYQSRFPDRYTMTVNANASFDADAFAHGGVLGIAIATMLLVAVRVGAACLATGHPIVLAAYGTMLCFLAVLPSSASVQAILGANGLVVVPALVLALFVFRDKQE